MKNTKKISLHQKNNQEKETRLTKILLILFLPYISLSLGQNGFLGLLPFVREEFGLSRVQVGYYSTSFFISATFVSVFTGNIVDNLGPKKSILLGIGCMGFLLMFHGLSTSYTLLLFMAFLAGFGFSIITPSVTKGVILASPQEKRAISMGFTQTGFGVGGIAGAILLPLLGKYFGWRAAVQLAAVFILLTGPFVYKFYQEQNNIRNIFDAPEFHSATKQSFKNNLLSLFTNKMLLRICVFGILFGVLDNAPPSHFTVFLTEDLGMSKVMAGFGFSILHLGGMIGLLVWGRVSDRFFQSDRRLGLFLVGLSTGIFYLLFGLFLNHAPISPVVIFFLSFLLGLSSLGWMGVYLMTVGEVAGSKQAGIATGLALLFIRIGMLIAPPIFGVIADISGYYRYSWLTFGFVITGIFSLFFTKKLRNCITTRNNELP